MNHKPLREGSLSMIDLETDVVIIGAGVSGLYAAYLCAEYGMKVCVLDSANSPGGQCLMYLKKMIYDIPGVTGITGQKLIDNLCAQATNANIIFQYNVTINDIKKYQDFYVINNIKCKAVILSVGHGRIQWKQIPVPNECLPYVSYDYIALRNKSIMILGGGDTAIEKACHYSKDANEVVLVHRRDQFRAHDATLSELNKQINLNNLMCWYKFDSCILSRGQLHVKLVHTKTGAYKTRVVDYIMPCYGLQSCSHNFTNLKEYMIGNKFIVDTSLKVVHNIYALGDCIAGTSNRLIAQCWGDAAKAVYHIRAHVFKDRIFKFTFSTSRV